MNRIWQILVKSRPLLPSLLDFCFARTTVQGGWGVRSQQAVRAALPCPRARGRAPCTPRSRRTGSRPSPSWSAAAPGPPCPSRGARGTRAAGGPSGPWRRPGSGTACPGTPGRLVNSSSPSFLVTW